MWVDNDVPNWFSKLNNFYWSPFSTHIPNCYDIGQCWIFAILWWPFWKWGPVEIFQCQESIDIIPFYLRNKQLPVLRVAWSTCMIPENVCQCLCLITIPRLYSQQFWPTRPWFFTSDLLHRSYGMIYGARITKYLNKYVCRGLCLIYISSFYFWSTR
jgi:hypothetical protein